MHSAQVFSLLALAGSALAAPAPYRGHGGHQGHVVYETVVHTAYVTEIVGGTQPTAAPPAPAPTTTEVVVAPAPTSEAAPIVTSVVVVAPSSAVVEASPSATATATPSTSTGYMAIVDEWRVKLGLEKLTQSSLREATALKTAQDGNGQMVHQLLPGTFGQVLAPGGPDDFYHVFVGGWLCEKPDMAGMNGVCATASEGWFYTSTGHADILTSTSYKTIGCAEAGNIWACDLGQE